MLDSENQLLNNKEITSDKSSPWNKQKILIVSIIILVVLIIIITLIVVFSLRDSNNDDIEERPPLIFNSTSGNHTHTIIFMPGYSNQPEDFKNFFINRIQFSKKNDTNIIILRSPLVYSSAMKKKDYSWFDIYKLPIDNFSVVNFEDLNRSAEVLEKFVNNEVNILNGSYEKIIVGGHSQGAAISLYKAYTSDKNYGGVFAFSGFLSPGEIKEEKRTMKVYMGYGDKDEVILPSFINKSIEGIMGFEGLDLHIYENYTHKISRNMSIDASIFLDNLIK